MPSSTARRKIGPAASSPRAQGLTPRPGSPRPIQPRAMRLTSKAEGPRLVYFTTPPSGRVRGGGARGAQRDGPPGELIEHGLGVDGRLGGERPSLLPGCEVAGERQAVTDGLRVQFGERVLQVEYRVAAARDAAVADEPDGLGCPVGEVPVDGGLQGGRVTVVVLRRDQDDGVRACDA